MVRSYQVDTALLESLPELESLHRSKAQVGLVIGRLGVGQRDFVYMLLKAPDAEVQKGEAAATLLISTPNKSGGGSKKGAKSSQAEFQLKIAADALVEHGLQVSALLPGGLELIGFFIACPEGAFAGSLPQLCTISDKLWAAKGETRQELLLMHVDTATRKLSGREYSGDSKQGVKPCELKQQDLLSNLEILQCSFPVDITISPVTGNLGDALSVALGREASTVRSSIACVAGELLAEGTSVGDLHPAGSSGRHEVELLCTPSCSAAAEGIERMAAPGETSGRVRIQGTVHGRAYAYKRESTLAAVSLLKEDVARSLVARADVLILDAEEGDSKSRILIPPSDKVLRIELPRRAFFPVTGALQFSDYVLAGEGAEQVQSTASEALSLDLEAGSISWPEDVALIAKPAQLKTKDSTGISDGLGEGRPAIPFGLKTGRQVVTISTIICVMSCLISYVILSGILVR